MKRAIVRAFLVFFAAWPLVHAGLSARYGIDPWKLAGFGMYSVPGAMKTVRVMRVASDGSFELLDYQRYSNGQRAIVDKLRELRRSLGALQPLDGAAAALLALHPDWEGVVISVVTLELEPETARLDDRSVVETFWRDGRDEPFRPLAPGSGIRR